MKSGRLTFWLIATAALFATADSQALAGKRWKFNVVNQSNKAALEFRTQEDGKWSTNWIAESMEPGDRFNMDFEPTAGDCAIRTQIQFANGALFDAPVDYCKVNNIYLHDDGLTWD